MPLTRVATPRRLAALLVAPLLLAPLTLAAPAAAVPGATSQVWINEIHYDNGGADVGEAIEVVAPAGTDVSGYSLVLYNGNGGGSYGTFSLSSPATSGGWSFYTVATLGLQNGSPDGVALINGTTVVQFLSYEGPFTASGGPATGQTSTDIGVSESGSEPAGLSLQLTGGPGSQAGHFTWAAPSASTFGAANTGQTFVSAGDAAPSVASTTPANGATDVPVDSNLTVTFSEPVALGDNPFDLSCTTSGTNSVTVTGGQTTYTLDPASDFVLGETCTATVTASQVTDVDVDDPPDNMAADFSWSFETARPAPSCDDPESHTISQVQGSGATSPLVSTDVTVQAVVTADRTSGLSGFFIQEEAADEDGNPATSEGVFVRTSLPAGAAEGDTVQVTGGVREFTSSGTSQTQISSGVSVLLCGPGELPPSAVLTFPVGDVSEFERYEGMRVTMPQSLVISEYFNYDRFNETVVGLPLPGRDRFFTPTAVVEPGAEANDLAAEYAKRRITIDDGRSSQNPTPPYFPGTVDDRFTLANTFRGGDTLTGITGVVENTFGLYRVHPTADATYAAVNPRPEQPPVVGGDVKVGSFNVLNYFLTLDQIESSSNQADWVCGGLQNLDCRGADASQPNELPRQREKIVDAISRLDADVVGLMEMENTPGVQPAADLVDGLNDLLGTGTYDYIDTGVIGTDAIRVGLLYQPGNVTPVGDFEVLDSSVDPRFDDNRNRPALAQTFAEAGTGNRFTVAVNHLKSKGSGCGAADPDTGDGQGNCNLTRTAAASALADWMATDPTGSGDPDRLIIGDLNSYDHEDPIKALEGAGFTDLVKQFGGEYAYGYVFDGQVGYLDHGLANASLQPQVTGAGEWHLNADEPDILDYDTSFKEPDEEALYEPNAFRSSDHDAVLIGLDLIAEVPVITDVTGNGSVDCGGVSSLTVEFSDASLADTHDATVDWGDGTSDTLSDVSSPFTATHAYDLAGAYTASVTVEDSSGNVSDPESAELVVDYTVVDGALQSPIGTSTTKKYGSTTPVKVILADCDGSHPSDLAPTLTVTRSGYSLDAGVLRFDDGQYILPFHTGNLPGPGTYTYTVTVPSTGQQVTATVTLRR